MPVASVRDADALMICGYCDGRRHWASRDENIGKKMKSNYVFYA